MVESLNRSIHIYLTDGEVIMHTEKLPDFEKRLSGDNFLRCHQSYVISTDHIAKLLPHEILMHTGTGEISAPISRRYAADVKVTFLRNLGCTTM